MPPHPTQNLIQPNVAIIETKIAMILSALG
jgi:hypothetical protein